MAINLPQQKCWVYPEKPLKENIRNGKKRVIMCRKFTNTHSLSKIKNLSNSSRYRILLLTSAPILATLVILIAITLYWSFTYTWKNTLHDVSTRLKIAQKSLQLIEKTQVSSLSAITQSYNFQELLNHSTDETKVNKTLIKLQSTYNFDYIKFSYSSNSNDSISLGSHFDIFTLQQLKEIDPKLVSKAKIDIYNSDQVETKALILRTIAKVNSNDGDFIGYIEAGLVINNSINLVDKLRDLIYPPTSIGNSSVGTVTIFLGDLRISTNVPTPNSPNMDNTSRAIGTKASEQVTKEVLLLGKEWIGIAKVVGDRYITAYQPIRGADNTVIGMLYTGYSVWSFLRDYIISISIILITAVLLLFISTYFVIRESFAIFSPLEKIRDVVLKIRNGEHARIGELGLNNNHELSLLSNQFNQMLDELEERNAQISSLVSDLEIKVEERTARLKVKAKLLEQHIDLLNQTKNKLVSQEKFAALGILTAGIAHEINNPIAVILGNVELIKRSVSKKDVDIESEIQIIFSQIDRIKSIIYSLLQYSKSSSNSNYSSVIQDINPIVFESITLTNTGSNKKNIQFKVHCWATKKVLIDKNQLLQILINLELNAIDAMNHHGDILVSTHDVFDDNGEPTGVVVKVTDKGCGIDRRNINKIFDPFFTTKKEGTGLGLAICKDLVNQMDGKINVSINEQNETIFTVFLPLPLI
ncbi:sensor histidine kinase [Vibrio salinus]|uniref:sensor histidine kinase n=1 Tax=Vibrio salinus TaxID=2899784 RepID=UPI001E370F41|nr:cache domain-containing protein [Vibrio salinus]MCE0492524.1 cache domain-containing protein [Vibrio salinus]